jgi:hypothetical protein
MSKPVKAKPRNTTVGQDIAEIAQRATRSSSGLIGNAAAALANRGHQIDSAVHDRQHTDKNNK